MRVYTLTKQLPGLWSATDLLEEDGQLLVELEAYAQAEVAASNERANRDRLEQQRAARHAPGRRRFGLFGKRSR